MTNNDIKQVPFILIDDNPLDLKISERLLLYAKLANRVTIFLSPLEALAAIRKAGKPEQATVILLDIQMPEMNGFEFLAEYHELPPEIRKRYFIFMLSSTLDDADLIRVVENHDALALLPKPLDYQALKAALIKIQNLPI